MRNYLSLLFTPFVMVWLLSGCNSTDSTEDPVAVPPNKAPITQATEIKLNDRHYYVATPSEGFNAQKSYKLLLAFHGSRQAALSMQSMTALESISKHYIVVYPQSKVEEWNEGCNCNKPNRLGINDLSFVEDVVADVKTKYNIINNELYAVGFSQGGLFTQNLMCNSQLTFNAIASVASPMSEQLSQSCQIEHKTNYLMVHGTADNTLPYHGLSHSNFGLISSEAAIELIAKQNNINTEAVLDKNNHTSTFTFKNETHTNQLVAIIKGGHSWTYNHFNTSKEVINFFDAASPRKLDTLSSMYRVNNQENKDVHVRSMGLEHTGPAVVLLSGFNKNFHADSAWFSLLQPLIAKTHRVHVIERYGNGFSSLVEQPSYSTFAPALDKTLALLNEQQYLIVSFASANILAHVWQNSPHSSMVERLKGMVWIDPDILLPHSISLYQDWPVSWYREVASDLIPHITAGNWTARTFNKLAEERSTISALIPTEHQQTMNWPYFDLISQSRASINKQLIRAKEIINYHDDLASMLKTEISTSVPITVINTDFESHDIASAEPEFVDTLIKWQQEGDQWSQLISEQSGGQYIPLINSEHMAAFQHPNVITEAISALSK